MKIGFFIGLVALVTGFDATAMAQVALPLPVPTNRFDNLHPCKDRHLPIEKRVDYCNRAVHEAHYDAADEAQNVLVDLYTYQGKFDEALKLVDMMRETWGSTTGSRLVPVLILRAGVYAAMGRYDDAMIDADYIVRYDADEAEAYNNRCWLHAIAGRDLDAALADCNHALEREPGKWTALDSRGMVYFKMGRFADALADYNAVLEKESKAYSSRYAKGIVELRLGNSDAGHADISAAVDRYPDVALEMSLFGMKVSPAN